MCNGHQFRLSREKEISGCIWRINHLAQCSSHSDQSLCCSSTKGGYRQIVSLSKETEHRKSDENPFRYGLAGSANTTGDDQKKLDVLANELFINMLKSSYTVYAMASEENENLIEVEVPKQVREWIVLRQ